MSDEINLDELLDDPERKVEELDGYHFGDRIELINDIEFSYAGAQGRLLLETVGAEQYGNLRKQMFFVEDGMDMPMEVHPSQFRVLL